MKRPPEESILAAGIEHDWSDVLFPASSSPPERFLRSTDGPPPGRIHSPFPALDAGAGCRRFLWELLREGGHFRRAVPCEPMAAKADLLLWLFAPDATEGRVPCSGDSGTVQRFRVTHPTGLSCGAASAVDVRAVTLEEFAPEMERNGTLFGLVACLNVIDHVPEPHILPELLARLTRPEGSLAISSPLDWHEEFSPRRHWKHELSAFFRDSPHWEVLRGSSMPFIFRPSSRTLVVFQSELLFCRRSGD